MESNLSRIASLPDDVAELVKSKKYYGQMNGPDGSAHIKGACGDQMEFYFAISGGKIVDIKFHTDGCFYTTACGAMTCKLADGKTIAGALSISVSEVIGEIKTLPRNHMHCAILAVSTLYKAIADYLLKP